MSKFRNKTHTLSIKRKNPADHEVVHSAKNESASCKCLQNFILQLCALPLTQFQPKFCVVIEESEKTLTAEDSQWILHSTHKENPLDYISVHYTMLQCTGIE